MPNNRMEADAPNYGAPLKRNDRRDARYSALRSVRLSGRRTTIRR